MKKRDKIKDLKKMGKGELLRTLDSDREKLRGLRFDLAAGKVKNVREISALKKNIARTMYFIHQSALKEKIRK